MRRRDPFTTVRTEGGLLPADLLQRIAAGDRALDGLDPASYHLVNPGERLNEAVSRSWNRLSAAWAAFRKAAERLPPEDPGTTATRERWLLPLFQELGYGRLPPSRAVELHGRSYPITHVWQAAPIHLVGCGIDLDRRTAGVAGAARSSPHSLVQEFLNKSPDHLWGFVSNGRRLRVLRDNASLTRQAFLEFDLEGMMEGEVFADFVLLWLVCHQSRVEAERPEACRLEQWAQAAREQGARMMERLREGVETAVKALGSGFLRCPQNADLRERLRTGTLPRQDYYRQLLRLVYRLLFLFAAEDRGLLPDPGTEPEAQERYLRYYSAARLRTLAARLRGTRHTDLYAGLAAVMERLGSPQGAPGLGLSPLGSFLWSAAALPDLMQASLANRDLLEAVRALSVTREGKVFRNVDYKNLGSEELGSVYESLLELHPEMNLDAAAFDLGTAGGHERKTTGSYYTPRSLITCLLDSALTPVLEEAAAKPDPEQAILSLKVCDPACGSGHFLIAAAHRIARRLAAVRTGDEEPSPEAVRTALRDVIGRSIYGVDLNPLAVELCKVNLWMEALEPGKPLSFLDHHVKCGNSLLGAVPALLARGIPDAAFNPIEGDDKECCKKWKKRNRLEREAAQETLFVHDLMPWDRLGDLAASMAELEDLDDTSLEGVLEKERRYEEAVRSSGYLFRKLWADAWCAAFVWHKRETDALPYPVTEEVFRKIEKNPHHVPGWLRDEVQRLATRYGFFPWHLEFPDVFRRPAKGEKPENEEAGWSGGFDVVLGNPPWERVKIQEKEWFAARRPDIAAAPNAAARKQRIAALRQEDPALYSAFLDDLRKAEGESRLVRDSGRYPLCGRGDVNTYSIFAELKRTLCGPRGRVGCIVPSGIATDDTTKFFFQDLFEKRALASLYDFENRAKLFPAVDSRMKFCLLTLAGRARPAKRGADLSFFLLGTDELAEEERRFTLSAEDIALINPNTRTCPIFRTRRDAEITKAVYRRVPVLIKEGPPEENPWGIRFLRMLDMANDSHLFRTREQLEADGWVLEGNVFRRPLGQDASGVQGKAASHRDADREPAGLGPVHSIPAAEQEPVGHGKAHLRRPREQEPAGQGVVSEAVSGSFLPLYEAKMIHHFHHRFGDYADHPPGSVSTQLPDVPPGRLDDPHYQTLPRYWVPARAVEDRLAGRWDRGWLLGWRDICRSTDERTVIAGVLPWAGVGDKFLLMFPNEEPHLVPCLLGNLDALAFDYCSRQKVGGTSLKYFTMKQLPVLPPGTYDQPCTWERGTAGFGLSAVHHTQGKAAAQAQPRDAADPSPVLATAIAPPALPAEGSTLLSDTGSPLRTRRRSRPTETSSSSSVPRLETDEGRPLTPAPGSLSAWLLPRVLELTYTAWDLAPFARDLGYEGPPFRWDDERRFLILCELDAAFFHLYLGSEEEWTRNGTPELLAYFPGPRDAADYILDTFPIVRRKDEERHGEYRTKRVILEIYDELTHATRTGSPYHTRLTPPPADARIAHNA